jgi:UDPglucose 6-dehydrogenase
MDNVRRQVGDAIAFADDAYSAVNGADALIIATEWSAFRTPDFARLSKLLREKVIFDGRNLYEIEQFEGSDFYYESIGRRVVDPRANGQSA